MSVRGSALGLIGVGGHATDEDATNAWANSAARMGGITVYRPDYSVNLPIGAAYYNTTTNCLRIYNGTTWDEFAPVPAKKTSPVKKPAELLEPAQPDLKRKRRRKAKSD
tara:strand:+ start:995 stop:1321 length:327 start_codon:yes stop_codon:yes gene_type:complete